MMVNAFDESPDVVAWILEEAVKSDSIDQMNVMEMIESSENLTWREARTMTTQRSELYQ